MENSVFYGHIFTGNCFLDQIFPRYISDRDRKRKKRIVPKLDGSSGKPPSWGFRLWI